MEYLHKVQYYETDRMGITHHSNYIRWMEEARIDFLSQLGWDYDRLESEGIISPVLGVQVKYKKSTTFPDEISIAVSVADYRNVRLKLAYEMKNRQGETVCTAESEHCFINGNGNLIVLKKQFPKLHEDLMNTMQQARLSY